MGLKVRMKGENLIQSVSFELTDRLAYTHYNGRSPIESDVQLDRSQRLQDAFSHFPRSTFRDATTCETLPEYLPLTLHDNTWPQAFASASERIRTPQRNLDQQVQI